MAFTLSKLLQAMYFQLGQGSIETATAGSTSTVVDSAQSANAQPVGWTLFIASTTDGLAPEGEFKKVTGYSSGTFTVASAFSAAVEAGDTYKLVPVLYPLNTMIEAANAGVRSLGPITLVDTTTLTYAVGQSEYPASVVWKRSRPTRIDIQTNVETNDNQWQEISPAYWDFVPALPGQTGLIIFNSEVTYNNKLRIWYTDAHPQLVDYNDPVSEIFNEELVVQACVRAALKWQNGRQDGGDTYLLQRQNEANQDQANAQVATPVEKPRRKPRLVIVK